MFTGIVETVGRIRGVRDAAGARVLVVDATLGAPVPVGESVAVNGVCLTVERSDERGFEVTAVPETLARTNLGEVGAGARVNLERALTLERALGGHLVQGHVDGVGRVVSVERAGGERAGSWLELAVPADVHDLCVEKGSVTIDGVSLTVARRAHELRLVIALVPHTLEATIAGEYAPGRRVNVEGDVVARYVREYVRRLYAAAD